MKVIIEINEKKISDQLRGKGRSGSRFTWLTDEGNKWCSEKIMEMLDEDGDGFVEGVIIGSVMDKYIPKMEYYYEKTDIHTREQQEYQKQLDYLKNRKLSNNNNNSNNEGVK